MASAMKAICAAATLLAAAAGPAAADVSVWFEATDSTVAVGETVEVDLMASFSESVVAWGLDLTISEPGFVGLTNVVIGPLWDVTDTLDLDGLAGLDDPPGLEDTVLLATFTFEGLAEGLSPLTVGYDGDEDEGFLTEFNGLDTTVSYTPGTINVVPEPASLGLLGLGVLALSRRRRFSST